jgi:hypothetical protein
VNRTLRCERSTTTKVCASSRLLEKLVVACALTRGRYYWTQTCPMAGENGRRRAQRTVRGSWCSSSCDGCLAVRIGNWSICTFGQRQLRRAVRSGTSWASWTDPEPCPSAPVWTDRQLRGSHPGRGVPAIATSMYRVGSEMPCLGPAKERSDQIGRSAIFAPPRELVRPGGQFDGCRDRHSAATGDCMDPFPRRVAWALVVR